MISPVYCEIAAAGFFAIIFFADLIKKQLPTRRTVFFQLTLCMLMLSSFFMVDADLSLRYGESTMIDLVVQSIFMYTEFLCCIMLHYYILSLGYRLAFHRKVVSSIGAVFTLFVTVTELSSPWTGWVFYFDDQGVFCITPIFWGIVGIIGLMLFSSLFTIWNHCKNISLKKKIMSSLLVMGFILAVGAEMLKVVGLEYLKVFIVFFAYAFYLSLQSPDFFVDNATGTYNRNGFFEVMQERLEYKKNTSCLILRVRNFHSMNMIYGGDVLRTVQKMIAKVLLQHCREETVYHIGSSTFAIFLDSREEVRSLYELLHEQIPETWELDNQVVNQEYSFYEINYPEDGEEFEELVQRIHYARSDHESTHRPGELVHLKPEAVEQAEEKKEVAHLVEEAIMDNSIELHFQPIFSFEKGRVTSLEVLSRLKDKNKNYINPEYFIHVAEENHTIIQLGEQIYRKACIFASKNHIFDYGIEDININLSPAQCRYEHLTEELVSIAAEYGIPMERMHLEITESEFTDKDAVERTLRRLKETGAKVALDDFGTGNSTLCNILELPVDFVKIDKSLVWSFAEGKDHFLNDLMPMIKAEGKKIIAEGIETTDHIDIIKQLQGDYLQGYYYSKPLPEEEFMRFLKQFNGEALKEESSELLAEGYGL